MSESCAIIPAVKDTEGNIRDSKLFMDLYKVFNKDRQATVSAYLKIKSDGFQEKYGDTVQLDAYGEPTLSSLIEVDTQGEILNKDNVPVVIAKEAGFINNKGEAVMKPRTIENTESVIDKAVSFNEDSEFKHSYVALPMEESSKSGGMVGVQLVPATPENVEKAAQMQANRDLNNSLKELLASNNIPIQSLTALEEQMGINGMVDFTGAEQVANGIKALIKVSPGLEGQVALPEEISHIIVEAMRGNALMDRLLASIEKTGAYRAILGESFDRYDRKYAGDVHKLATEAAGKLLAGQFKEASEKTDIPAEVPKNLLSRIIEAVRNFFKSLTTSEIDKAIADAKYGMNTIASNILKKGMAISLDKAEMEGMMYSLKTLDERIARDKSILERAIRNEAKKAKIYERNKVNPGYSSKQSARISSLSRHISKNEEVLGIIDYLQYCQKDMTKLLEKLNSFGALTSLKEKASLLIQVKNWVDSYKEPLRLLKDASLDEEDLSDDRYKSTVNVHDLIKDTMELQAKIMKGYKDLGLPLFIEFIKPFAGETIEIPFKKWKGKKFTVEELMETANGDISLVDLYLRSMSKASDPMLRLMDRAVKRVNERKRQRVLEIQRQIKAAGMKLRQAGITNTSFLYAKDDDGSLTGYYISEYNWARYIKDRDAFFDYLNEKYSGPTYAGLPSSVVSSMKGQEAREWYEKHADKDPNNPSRKVPKLKDAFGNNLYTSTQYTDIMNGTDAKSVAMREFYETFKDLKEQLDELLPEGMTSFENAIKIHKSNVQRAMHHRPSDIAAAVKEQFNIMADEEDFGTRKAIIGFNNEKIMSLPIYYLHFGDDTSMNDLSEDAVSTLIAYADMAIGFEEMFKVIDMLELGRQLITDPTVREIKKEEQGSKVEEVFRYMGTSFRSMVLVNPENSNIKKRLDKFFEMQVYQRYMADERLGNLSLSKLGNSVVAMTALCKLGINLLAGMTNVLTGTVFTRIETIAGQHWNIKDMSFADLNYFARLPKVFMESMNRTKTSKLSLFIEEFDVLQNYSTDARHSEWVNYNNALGSLGNVVFILNNAGEHYLQTRKAIALAHHYEMKGPNGEKSNLWEALKTVPIDPNNPRAGKKLIVDPNYTKPDGTPFTQEDLFEFKQKHAAIAQRIDGVYNKEDMAALQSWVLGRAVFQFRKYLVPNLTNEWGRANIDFETGEATEGYFNTSLNELWNVCKMIADKLTPKTITIKYDTSLTQDQKYNLRRAGAHIVQLMLFAAAVRILFDDDDDKKNPWAIRIAEYLLRREYSEVAALSPMPNLMWSEGKKILSNPTASMSTMEDIFGLFKLLDPDVYKDENRITRGRYKGRTQAHKIVMDALPFVGTIERAANPDDSINFIKK